MLNRWKWIAAALVAALVLAWWFLVARNEVLPLEWYAEVTDQTLVVIAGEGHHAWTRVTGVTETSSEVRIRVESFEWLRGLGNASAQLVALTIHLEQPLGDRPVVDSQGDEVRRVRCLDAPC